MALFLIFITCLFPCDTHPHIVIASILYNYLHIRTYHIALHIDYYYMGAI